MIRVHLLSLPPVASDFTNHEDGRCRHSDDKRQVVTVMKQLSLVLRCPRYGAVRPSWRVTMVNGFAGCGTSGSDWMRSPVKTFNLNADEWDRTEEREGWRFKDAWVGAHTDAELIGASMYEVEPGNKQGPFHTHHANEEWAIVLRGEPTLRTHEGEQQLRQGDVVAFPRGKEGAHQIRNDTDAPVRVLMLSTVIAPDIVEYLDTGKVGARSVAGERIMFGRPGPELGYWEGEE